MRAAEKHPAPISLEVMTPQNKLLYGILVQVLNGRALTILRVAPPGNGDVATTRRGVSARSSATIRCDAPCTRQTAVQRGQLHGEVDDLGEGGAGVRGSERPAYG
eukprot:2408725-Heterocapsa_arctica.AAC.1